MKLRLVYPRIKRSGGTLTKAEHQLQRDRVEAAERLSSKRSERRDEAATQARLYGTRDRLSNVVPIRARDGDQTGPRPAA